MLPTVLRTLIQLIYELRMKVVRVCANFVQRTRKYNFTNCFIIKYGGNHQVLYTCKGLLLQVIFVL